MLFDEKAAAQRERKKQKEMRLHMAYKSVKRLREMSSVLTRHGFFPLMERLHLSTLVSVR